MGIFLFAALFALVTLTSTGCAPAPLHRQIPGLMEVNSVGIDEHSIALSSANDSCDHGGDVPDAPGGRISVLFFFFSFESPFDEGKHTVSAFDTPDEEVPKRPVFVTFRKGSNQDTCDSPVFIDDWSGELDVHSLEARQHAAFSFELLHGGDTAKGSFETTENCDSVFELGNGCDPPEAQ